MSDCPHGMPSPASCIDCMDEGPVTPLKRPAKTASHPFTARYDGYCFECHLPIHAGQEIVFISETGSAVHADCAP